MKSNKAMLYRITGTNGAALLLAKMASQRSHVLLCIPAVSLRVVPDTVDSSICKLNPPCHHAGRKPLAFKQEDQGHGCSTQAWHAACAKKA